MSTQENRQDKPEGLSKYIKRMRTVLKRGSTKTSVSSMQDITGQAGTGNAGQTAITDNAEAPIEPHPNPEQLPTKPQEPTVVSHWSAIQQAKAQALFAKYGLTLEPGEWKSPSDMTVQRVTKPIRMRVRRTCHRCQTTFGINKVCVNCQHTRCKKCPRHPSPKSKPTEPEQQGPVRALLEEKKAKGARAAEVELPRRVRKEEITIPSRTGGQDLVRRPARQRIRRTCHECETLFPTEHATECIDCGHLRCKICPRDPPKLRKYPDGYPGDVEPSIDMPQRMWRKPRQRVRYTCHVCTTLYRGGERNCSSCGQEKGPSTIRDPPKKTNPNSTRRW